MFELRFNNFRGFHYQEFVGIRPITLLVGENSSGKSSFLAGLKYILDFISGNEEASFNKDPFQLGTFQQISHYRGGKAGRAHEFEISLRMDIARHAMRRRRQRAELPATESVIFSIHFSNLESQAVITSASLTSGGGSLVVGADQERVTLEYINREGDVFPLEDTHSFPRVARTEFARYWPFVLRDLRYRLMRSESDEQETLFPEESGKRISALLELAEGLSFSLSEKVEATSAIRTKPRRTYTPGTEIRDGEGSHVPFEMAKLYRAKNKEGWRKLKSSIENFGEISEMFRTVEIKSFGKTASDPFQIQFSSEGPRTNLVDLGYGTSQILPILYLISTGTRNSTHVIQQPEVHLHPKAQAALGEYFIRSYKRTGQKFVLETHSDFIVDRIRNAILKGVVQPEEVSLLFFQRERLETRAVQVDFDENGEPLKAPKGYRDFFAREQLRMLGIEDAYDN